MNPVWGHDMPLKLIEAAEFTGMPLSTFKQKVYSREIASVKIGKLRKVCPSDIRAYLEKHRLPAL